MLLQASDFKVKSESGAPPTGKKKKRRPTPAQSAASKANAARSTGPHDTSKTRLNAVRHGCCCELPVLMPGEDPQAVSNKINRYITQLGAETEPERDTVEVAVMNHIRGKRANASEVAANTRVVNNVLYNFDNQQSLRCADLVGNLAAAPAATITQLVEISHGITWCLGQVEMLEQHLRNHPGCGFHPDQRVRGIHIFGKQPQDLFTDNVVMDWNFLYISALHGPGPISAEDAAELLATDRPEGMELDHFERRLGEALANLFHRQEARARLQELLAKYKADLFQRLQQVVQREAIDKALAVQAAMVSVNDECMRYLRYRRESEQGNQAALRTLHQLQRMRLNYGDQLVGPLEEPVPVPNPGDSRPETAVPAAGESPSDGAEEAVHRNEADATQVDGGPVASSEPRTFSTVSFTIGRPHPASEPKPAVSVLPVRPDRGGSEGLKE
jgi:hypothetical protein